MVESVPQVPILDVERGKALVNDFNQLESMEDVPQAFGTAFGAQPRSEILLDAQQNPLRDESGEIVTRPYGVDAYNNQLEVEREAQADIAGALYDIAEDPNATSPALERAMESTRYAAIGGHPRQESMVTDWDDTFIRNYADKSAPPLDVAIADSYNALFQNDSRAQVQDGYGGTLPAGTHVLNQLGMLENEDAPKLFATLGAVAFNRAISQTPQYNKKFHQKNEVPQDKDGYALDDVQYLSDFISSIRHFLNNGLRNVQLDNKVPREAQEALAKALALDAINRGMVMPVHTKGDPRPMIVGMPGIKARARTLQLAADTLAGDSTMTRSLTVPARGGSSFTAGGPRMTKRSVKVDESNIAPYLSELVTSAAELTKDILGSIAMQFRVKDLKFTNIMIEQVLAPDMIQRDTNGRRFMWSNHPAAHRYGLSEGNYLAAKNNHKPPRDYDGKDAAMKFQYERESAEAAIAVMGMERDKVLMALKAISGSPGLRYGQWSHSIANQRFFPNSFDLDFMGNKNVIRDTLSLAKQDIVRPIDMFSQEGVYRVKYLAKTVFSTLGEEQHNRLTNLAPTERGALGTMYNAVVFFYTAVEPGLHNITKMPILEAIKLYTPEIGNRLAELGAGYNKFLEDPEGAPQDIKDFLFGMERGESLGAKNLVDDFFQLKQGFGNFALDNKEPSARASVPMTHHAFDDGNQNGIFLQSLFFGADLNSPSYAASGGVTVRLGTANPKLADMRTYFMNVSFENLDKMLMEDRPDTAAGWRSFVAAAIEEVGADRFAKDFFKSPLMQAAYGKDASMFTDLLHETLFDTPLYSELVQKYLIETRLYSNPGDVALDLSSAVELGLREVLDTNGTFIMKSIARFMAVMGKSIMMPGPSGDTSVFTPVGTVLINRSGDSNVVVDSAIEEDSRRIKLSRPRASADAFVDPPTGAQATVPSAELGYMPQATRGTQWIFNRVAQRYDPFNNAIGTWMARAFAVLPIQSIDGDLVKWATIFANRGKTVPEPVMWVHDSSISTPSGSLLYRNVYNNIAIPRAIPQIAKFGKRIAKVVRWAKADLFDDMRTRRPDSVVGIGTQGEFAALGALFDEAYERFVLNEAAATTQPLARKMSERKEAAKLDRIKRTKEILKQAEQHGWIPSHKLTPTQAKYIAVSPFKVYELVNLAERYLQLDGPSDILEPWARNFEASTRRAGDLLNSRAGTAGIWQMSPSGAALVKPKQKKGEATKLKPPRAREVNAPEKTPFGGEDLVVKSPAVGRKPADDEEVKF
jgi:hypothetical protein